MNSILPLSPVTEDESKSLAQMIYKIGVPSAIALYLVYSLVNGGMSLLADIDKGQRLHIADSEVQKDLLKDIKDSSIRSEVYLRLQCLSMAKSDVEKQTCLTVR